MVNLFVYGTLKRGFPNHNEKLLGKLYQGPCVCVKPYPLVIANQFYSPVLIDEEGVGENVTGELYCVDNETLAVLDRLEGVGKRSGYHRTAIEVELPDQRRTYADTYMKNRAAIVTFHSEPIQRYEIDSRYVHASLR